MAKMNLTLPAIQRLDQKTLPLSSAQESLWFLQQLDPQTTAYNSSFLFKLTGGVDRQALQRALNELVLRHEGLRTLYLNREGKPVQVIQPFGAFELSCEDYSILSAEEREGAVRQYAAEHEKVPFNLEQETSGRYALLHAGPQEDYLFICVHHINWDAWSHHIFTGDLLRLYQSCRIGELPGLPELQVQYSDYAAVVNEWMSAETRKTFVEHWKQVLSGELPVLELPADRPRPAVQTDHGARYHFNLPMELSAQIKEFCRRERLTPFHFLLTAYAVLLMRYSGQEDIIIGCPFANRPRPEQDGLIGSFVNVLPIRLDLNNDPMVCDLLKQVRTVMLDAFTWQALPFATLAGEVTSERDLSRTPVYQVVMNMLNVPRRENSVPGLELSEVQRAEAPSQFDMTFEFSDAGEYFSGSVIFNTDLFDQSTIARMVSHFQNILGEMLTGSDNSISKVEMLSEAERRQILPEWNDTALEYTAQRCLHEWVEEQAEKTPDAPAVSFDGQVLSYRELNQCANQLAHALRRSGVGAGTLVALYLERSLEMIVGLLATLKAGGAYVPIDPVYPLERRSFILEDSAAPIVLTLRSMAAGLPDTGAQVLCIDLDEPIVSGAGSENLPNITSPENLAYVIYTSGSTGTPKGVLVTHHNVVRLFQATQPWYHFSANDVWTMFHSYAFDFSVWEIWGALIHGGLLVVVPYLVSRSPEAFFQLVKDERVTILNQTPSAFYQFVKVDEVDGAGVKLDLRFIIFGGEALDLQALRPWFQRHDDQSPRLVNMYGITETTVHVTYRPINWGDIEARLGSVIGVPIPDLQVYLLDAYRHICPIGVTGEIYVGGAGVARGYLNQSALTAERFVSDSFRRAGSGRLYKSGDLARRLPNGDLEYLGRADFQIKIRGFRVELGEIETLLGSYTGVQGTTVILREDHPGDKRLVAYIIPTPGSTVNKELLRDYLKGKLPGYMVPAAFVFMDAFPITPNGKVDRKSLPTPETGPVADQGYVPPRTPTEEILSKIWMSVIGNIRVGLEDDFFDSGGNSLSVVQVMARIRDEFEISIPVLRLFEYPRLSDLAAQIDFEVYYQKQDTYRKEEKNDQKDIIL